MNLKCHIQIIALSLLLTLNACVSNEDKEACGWVACGSCLIPVLAPAFVVMQINKTIELAQCRTGIIDIHSKQVQLFVDPKIDVEKILIFSGEKNGFLTADQNGEWIHLNGIAYTGKNFYQKKIPAPKGLTKLTGALMSSDWTDFVYYDVYSDHLRILNIETGNDSILWDAEKIRIHGSHVICLGWTSPEEMILSIKDYLGLQGYLVKFNKKLNRVSGVYKPSSAFHYDFFYAFSYNKKYLAFLDECTDARRSACPKIKILNIDRFTLESEIDLHDENPSIFCVDDHGKKVGYFTGKRVMLLGTDAQPSEIIWVIENQDQIKSMQFLNERELAYTRSDKKKGSITDILELIDIKNKKIILSSAVRLNSPFYVIEKGTKILCNFGESCPSEWPEPKGPNENQ